MVDILLDKMSSGNLISFDTLLQWSFNPQTEILCETQTNLTYENIVIIYHFNLLNNHDVMVLCNILLLVSTCGQRSDYLSAGETFQSKEQKLAQFKLAQNTKWRSLTEVLEVSVLDDGKFNICPGYPQKL